jgi:hypothetical protein
LRLANRTACYLRSKQRFIARQITPTSGSNIWDAEFDDLNGSQLSALLIRRRDHERPLSDVEYA